MREVSLRIVLAAVLGGSLLTACGGHSIPPAVTVPAPPSAQGMTILLGRDSDQQLDIDLDTTRFAAALADSFRAAGFRVEEAHGRRLAPFDIAVMYTEAFSHKGKVWSVQLSTEGGDVFEEGEAYGFDGRDRATRGAQRAPEEERDARAAARARRAGEETPTSGGASSGDALAPTDACFAQWKSGAVAGGKAGSFAPTTYGRRVAINGPREGAPPDTDERAAALLVATLLSCHGLAETVERIQSSGVATTTPMERLPTERLVAACEYSVNDIRRLDVGEKGGSYVKAILRGTGRVQTMDDACTIVAERDPRLAGAVARVRRQRDANQSAYATSGMAEITEQLGTEAREEHKQQVAQQVQEREQRDAQEQKARDEHDARMAQLPGLVQQSVQQAQAAIAPMQPGSLSPRAGQPKSQPQPAGNVGAAPLPGAQPATVATASGASAAAQAALQKCLSEPVTHTTTTRTNPFPSYQQTFQSLLAKARQGCAAATTWSAWQGCIGDNATGALWSFEGPAASDQAALAQRYGGVAIFFSGTSCLWGNIKGTRADCTTAAGSLAVVRNLCTTRLQADIDMMSCDAAMLPGVWSAEDARSDADAKKKHDASCYATSGK